MNYEIVFWSQASTKINLTDGSPKKIYLSRIAIDMFLPTEKEMSSKTSSYKMVQTIFDGLQCPFNRKSNHIRN